MNKKSLLIAIASALAVPGAQAAQDTSGMRYTSAAEGFYASLRVRLNSGSNDNAGMQIRNSSSRIGVRGSSDIGGGSEFFYRWELGVNTNSGESAGSTRLGYLGLRGNFGQIQAGSFWTQSYNWVYGTTDVANVNSGNFIGVLVAMRQPIPFGYSDEGRPGDEGGGELSYRSMLPARATNAIEYTTPEMNGFQAALLGRMENTGTASVEDDNDVDSYVLSAKYAIKGFTTGLSYSHINDGLAVHRLPDPNDLDDRFNGVIYVNKNNNFNVGASSGRLTHDHDAGDTYTGIPIKVDGKTEDHTALAFALGYAQDNWYVNGYYSKDNAADADYSAVSSSETIVHAGGSSYRRASINALLASIKKAKDTETMSLAGGVTMGKVALYAVYESRDNVAGKDGDENVYSTLGAQYKFNGQSRVWLEYAGQDLDTDANADDYFTIGLRHDF